MFPSFQSCETKKSQGVHVAVVLHHEIAAALVLIHAALRGHADMVLQEIVEQPDIHIGIAVLEPFVEQLAEEFAEEFRIDREGRKLAIRRLDALDELEEVKSLLHEDTGISPQDNAPCRC